MSDTPISVPKSLINALAEPYAFSVVRWPAVVGLMTEVPVPWPNTVQIFLGIWLAAMVLAAYGRGRGWGFGNPMLFLDGIIALVCWGHPSPWILACLPVLFVGLFAAQEVRLKVVSAELESDAQSGPETASN